MINIFTGCGVVLHPFFYGLIEEVFMIRVLFVCHGNICRSPMAEFLFKDFVEKKNQAKNFYIESCATSSEEIGNSVHYGTKNILNSLGINCSSKKARKMVKEDYINFDYIIGMDYYNIRNLNNFFNDKENKIFKLLDFVNEDRDVADPWYTGDFNKTYTDIMLGIEGFYKYLNSK